MNSYVLSENDAKQKSHVVEPVQNSEKILSIHCICRDDCSSCCPDG